MYMGLGVQLLTADIISAYSGYIRAGGVQLIFTSTRICTGLVYTALTTVQFT